jgi:carbon-monoxide dehydrogenase medium subunit
MKPPPFAYHAPTSVAEAVETLWQAGDEAKVLAGGQSLIPLLNFRMARPSALVDLNRIPELAYIEERDGGLAIGAMTRQRAVERSALVQERVPLLAEAVRCIGHLQIRARGTIGGNIAHADPASELPAVLVALEGRVTMVGPNGSRTVPAEEFFLTYFTTCLEPGEMVTEVWVPGAAPGDGYAWLEISQRHGDYALAGVAAGVALDQAGAIEDARIVLTGVGETPVRVPEAEARLRGERPDAPALDEALRLVRESVNPDTDVHASGDYRRQIAGVLTVRALTTAISRAAAGSTTA